MTSWIVAIDRKYPQHWEIAAEHGFWDMTKARKIAAGDPVYFWLSGKGLVSQTRATTDAFPLGVDEPPPWEDSGERTYSHRFHFDVLSEDPVDAPSWGTVQSATGVSASPHFGPNRVVSPEGEAWLAARFTNVGSLRPPDAYFPTDMRIEVEGLLGDDLRERAMRSIALRQGQPAFRKSLLAAYEATCAVTGYDTEPVLEAAHISPYLGYHTNIVANGLLLRADIHTLFDRFLLTVTPDYVVRVAPELSSGPYGALSGSVLRVPSVPQHQPSGDALRSHNTGCEWLAPARRATD